MNGITEGFRDVLFSEAKRKRHIEDSIRDTFLSRGYDEMITPTLEFHNLFHHEHSHIQDDMMYKLLDRKGNIMVLRPDMTLPIARIITSRFNSIITPTKVFYISNIYRVNDSHKGRFNEFTQGGIEIIGTSSVKADIEVIITAIRALEGLGFEEFKLELGHSGFYEGVTGGLDLDDKENEELKDLLGNKNTLGVKGFLRDRGDRIGEKQSKALIGMTECFGGFEILENIEGLIEEDNALQAIKELKKIYSYIKSLGLDKYITLDLSMVQDIDYYTGLIIKGYVNDIGQIVLSGGRYDNLYAELGKDLHSTGMAMNIDVLCELVNKRFTPKKKKLLVWYDIDYITEAKAIMESLRKYYRVEAALLDSKEDCLRYFKNKSFDCLLDISNDEELRVITDSEILCGGYEEVLSLVERCSRCQQ